MCVKSCFKAEVVLVNAHCHSLPAAMFVWDNKQSLEDAGDNNRNASY